MFACLSNLKQRCRELYKEQKLFYDHLMKMCRTCSKGTHKSVLRFNWRLKISKSKTSFQFRWLDIGDDFTHDSLRNWSWSFNINCRLYVGLQLSLIWISLIINGLRYQASSIWADRRWLLNWWQATVVRPVTEVHRREAPRVASRLPAQARAC